MDIKTDMPMGQEGNKALLSEVVTEKLTDKGTY